MFSAANKLVEHRKTTCSTFDVAGDITKAILNNVAMSVSCFKEPSAAHIFSLGTDPPLANHNPAIYSVVCYTFKKLLHRKSLIGVYFMHFKIF